MKLNGITIRRILHHRFQPFLYARCFSDASLPQPHTQNPNPSPQAKEPLAPSSLNDNELAKFAAIAETWWDSEGPFKPLHVMNPTRLAFIRSALCRHFKKDPYSTKPLEGLKIVDVGSGGGILSEPLARLGATVTGVDAVEKNIKIARLHADLDPTTSTIEYCCTTAEKLVEEGRKYDAVMALEKFRHIMRELQGAIIVGSIFQFILGFTGFIPILFMLIIICSMKQICQRRTNKSN